MNENNFCSVTYTYWVDTFDETTGEFDSVSGTFTTDLLPLVTSKLNQEAFISDIEESVKPNEKLVVINSGFNLDNVDIKKDYLDYVSLLDMVELDPVDWEIDSRLGTLAQAIYHYFDDENEDDDG